MTDKVIRDAVYSIHGYNQFNVPIKRRREMTRKFLEAKGRIEIYIERHGMEFEEALNIALGVMIGVRSDSDL